MQIHLDGKRIANEAQFHDAMREASGMDRYGGNLDALFDLLVAVIAEPVDLTWTDAARSRNGIGPRFDDIVAVIFDSIADRGDTIRFRLES